MGVIYTVREAMKHLGMDPDQVRGRHAGLRQCLPVRRHWLSPRLLGGKVVCVSYWDRDDRCSYTVSKAGRG